MLPASSAATCDCLGAYSSAATCECLGGSVHARTCRSTLVGLAPNCQWVNIRLQRRRSGPARRHMELARRSIKAKKQLSCSLQRFVIVTRLALAGRAVSCVRAQHGTVHSTARFQDGLVHEAPTQARLSLALTVARCGETRFALWLLLLAISSRLLVHMYHILPLSPYRSVMHSHVDSGGSCGMQAPNPDAPSVSILIGTLLVGSLVSMILFGALSLLHYYC